MKNSMIRNLIVSTLGLAVLSIPFAAYAEVHSKSKDVIVMSPSDLPGQAQLPGESLFLHSDNAGSTYLYVEQGNGSRVCVLDITDPAHIKLATTAALGAFGTFDFVRPIGESAALVRFRDGKGNGVIDLRKSKEPVLRMTTAFGNAAQGESLGQTAFLVVDDPSLLAAVAGRDEHIIDASMPSAPVVLATVKAVKQRLMRDDTGTTFLLGSEGLTVVRRVDVEEGYKIHLMQMQGN